jgi:hypothetical protein
MMIEQRITAHASPKTIFDIYAAVDRWHEWDPDTKAATIGGPFRAGASGTLTPAKGNTIKIMFTAVEPHREFVCEGGVPGFRMRFTHTLTPHGADTEIVHRVEFFGPLRVLFGVMIKRQLATSLPKTMASLKAYAERRRAA